MSMATFVQRLAGQGIELYPNGEQLGCRAPEDALTPQLIAQLKTHKQELLAYFAAFETHPLSHTQKGVWFELQFSPDHTYYHVTKMARLYSVVDVALLRQVFQQLVNRHPILRTTIMETDGQPVLQTHHYQAIDFTQIDASAWSWDEIEAQVYAYHEAAFDLSNCTFQVYLLTRQPDEHVLLIKLHHFFLDGWSMTLMLSELRELYLAAKSQRMATLPVVETTYADYVAWQQATLEEQGEALRAYWCEQLGGTLPILNLPTDRPSKEVPEQKVGKHGCTISGDLLQSLRTLARREGVTLSTLLLAAYNILLHRYSGQDDIVVGSMMAGRSREEFEGVLGYFLSPIALRATFTDDLTVQTFLKQYNQTVLGGMNHQDYPLPLVVEAVNPPHVSGRHPLYQATFNMQRLQRKTDESLTPQPLAAMRPTHNWDGLQLSTFRGIQIENPLDLTLHATDYDHRLQLVFSYDATKFAASTIGRMGQHFVTLLSSMVDDPTQPVQQLAMLTEAEYRQIVYEWNDTTTDFGEPQTIHALFEQQVQRTPDAIALDTVDEQVTYQQLNGRSNQLAHHLIKLGVRTDTLVAVSMSRSAEMIIALLAVLKAGGAYVPVDPTYPAERIRYMLEDSAAPILLTQSHLSVESTTAHVIAVDTMGDAWAMQPRSNPMTETSPADLAYVIYTSGSTGQPKGVLLEHGGAFNVACVAATLPNFCVGSRTLQLLSLSFDGATFEWMFALLNGATLILPAPNQETLGAPLAELLATKHITHAVLVPSVLKTLPKTTLPDLKLIITAGETCPGDVVNRWAPGRLFINSYGPTEGPIWASTAWLQAGEAIHIGRPISNRTVYILSDSGMVTPIGIPGELYMGGEYLARGYLNRPDLTAKSFIEHPQFGRLYKTGDLCRWRPDGNLEFLGRTDFQVKIRGFRIELSEIENVLMAQTGVREAAVLAREDTAGDQRLVAYVIGTVDINMLRQQVAQQLPNYMVPAAFVQMEAMPLTPNGKLDRNALPAPNYADTQVEFVAPRSVLEAQVAHIWCDVLGINQVGIYDDFFALGGHSLLATRVISQVRAQHNLELPLKTLFEASQLSDFVRSISRAQRATATITRMTGGDEKRPLSFAQQRLWFLDQFDPLSPHYNIYTLVRLQGTLDIPALEQSFAYLVERHESLRTTFDMVDGEPTQVIHAPLPFSLPVIAVADAEDALQRGRAEGTTPFNLRKGPLLRAQLFKIASDDHLLVITMHHIISDGWSVAIFFKELTHAYTAYVEGRVPTLPELPIQYADFAVWQRNYLQDEVLEQQSDFWRKQLQDAPPLLELPADRPRPAEQRIEGASYRFRLGRELTDQLNQLAQSHNVTLFMLLLTAFNVLLSRYSRQTDIVVGTPIANRNRAEIEGLIGFFINTLALRTQLNDNPTFTALLERVRETTLAAYEHQDLPFEQLVDALQLQRTLSYSPLFQVMFVLQNVEMTPLTLPGLTVSRQPIESTVAKFDLTLNLAERDGELRGVFEYSTALFDEATIASMATHLTVLLNDIICNPDQPIGQLLLLADDEYQQVVCAWNETAVNFGEPQTIHQLFEQQVARTPTEIALIFEDEQLTYAELNQRANRLAHHLVGLGVQADTLVAVAMERSIELVVSLLAVLKAGGAYVPIDPTYPTERIHTMLADSAASIILTQSHFVSAVNGQHLIAVDRFESPLDESLVGNPRRFQSVDSLAYVIYTSGSTGHPKGVAIEHRAAFNYLQWALAEYGVREGAGSILHSPLAFDLTVTSIWSPLLAGKPLTILPESHMVNALLARMSQLSDLSFVKLTPAHLQLINHQLEPEQFQGRTHGFIIGGEALHESVVAPWRHLAPDTRLINEYGPTEATVGCVIYTVTPEDKDEWIKIGRPIANTQIYIMDDFLCPVPIGVPGELYIGGAQLARGYLNRAELTAERFIVHPKFGRLYKTGDLCRWLRDGTIAYIGRTDFQVKIRGFRIELGEIESTLRTLDGVDEAVVLAREDNSPLGATDKRLVAYYTGESAGETLREQLAQRLPHYMVPTAFVWLDALPLTTNGKVNRDVLPAPEYSEKAQDTFSPPRNEIETVLAQAFATVLRLPQVGIHDDFFRMGGDSILSIQLVNRIAQKGYTVRVKDVFLHPTVAQLATIAQMTHEQVHASQAVQDGYAPLSPIQRWFLDANQPQMHHYNHSFLWTVRTPISSALLESAIGTLLQHHDALRFRYKQDERGWQQQYLTPKQYVPLEVIDLTDVDDVAKTAVIETTCTQAQTSLNPQEGELTRWVYFKAGEMGDRLLIVIHHLAVDGVSWHILLEDLATLLNGGALPPKTSSYRDWVETLQAATAQGRFDGEIKHWFAETVERPLPLDEPDAPNTMGSSHHLRRTLSREQTTHLLRTLPERHAMTLDALLLTALTETLTDWSGNDALRVQFESHGRQELFDTINLNRTIGWFTSVYPLTIPCFEGTAVKRIRYTLDTLRRVTDGGISFGALRDYHPETAVRKQFALLPTASVVYNYLGQMGGSNNSQFGRAPESAGRAISPHFQRDTLIDINAAVIDEQLQISWAVSPQIARKRAVSLQDTFIQRISTLIDEALTTHEQIAIPTDFANADISLANLESMLNSVTAKERLLVPSTEDEEF